MTVTSRTVASRRVRHCGVEEESSDERLCHNSAPVYALTHLSVPPHQPVASRHMPPRTRRTPLKGAAAADADTDAPAASPRVDSGLLSIILPTYNEAENLPIIVWLLVRELRKWCVACAVPCVSSG